MQKLFNEKDIIKGKNKATLLLTIGIVIFVFSYLGSAIFLFFINDHNFRLFVTLMVIISSLGGVIFFYLLFAEIIPIKKKIKFISGIDETKLIEYEGVVKEISDEITYLSYVKVLEISLDVNGEKTIVYLPREYSDSFIVDDVIHIKTFKHFIVEYEIKN